MRVRSEVMRSRRNLRGREHVAHLEIAYAHELSRPAACRPDISVDILGQSNHHAERLVVWVRQTTESPIFEEIESVVYSHPQVAGAVFQHGGDLVPRKTIAPADRRDRPVPDAIERSVICHPDRAVPAGQNARGQVLPQPLCSGEGDDTRISKAVDAARGSGPDDAFAVFEQRPHGIAGEAVRLTVALDGGSMDANDTACIGADPQTAVTIHHQAGDTDFASVKVRGDECFQNTVAQLLKPQPWSLLEQAHPERSIRRAGQTRYEGFDRVRLGHTTTVPANQGGRSSQP